MITWLYLNGVRGTGGEGGGRSDHVGKSLLKQQGSAQSGPSANWDIGGTQETIQQKPSFILSWERPLCAVLAWVQECPLFDTTLHL